MCFCHKSSDINKQMECMQERPIDSPERLEINVSFTI